MARCSISDLPDALLTAILACLKPADLHRAALVSRRWHECAHAPELCRSVTCREATRAQLRSLLAWLRRHGRHVRSLELHTDEREEEGSGEEGSEGEGSEEGSDGEGSEEEEEGIELISGLLAGCIAACAGAGGQLASLEVLYGGGWQLDVGGAWAPALTSLTGLQALRLTAMESRLRLAAGLHALGALRALRLASYAGLQVAPGARLPAGIEELELEDWRGEPLPSQLAGLSALHTLVLACGGQSPAAWGALERLPRLRRLHCTSYLPTCLASLTGLEELVLTDGEDAASLDAALRTLTGLTCLALIRGQPPPSVAGLACLQRACFLRFQGGPHYQPPAALPVGPWAASLRQLHVDYDTLLLSGQLLAAAGQLERVAVLGGDLAGEPSEAGERFWRWCGTHPPLRRLRVELERLRAAGPAVLADVAALRRARPGLQVECEAECGVVLFSRSVEEFHYHV